MNFLQTVNSRSEDIVGAVKNGINVNVHIYCIIWKSGRKYSTKKTGGSVYACCGGILGCRNYNQNKLMEYITKDKGKI